MMLNITDIQLRPAGDNYNHELVCLCDIVIADAIKLKDINICQGKQGIYITYPQMTEEARKQIYNTIMEVYVSLDQQRQTRCL